MIKTKKLDKEILDQLKTKDLVRIPASEEEYLSVAFYLPFKIEYHVSEIITIGIASYWHEMLASNRIEILRKLLSNKLYNVTGSNSGVQIPIYSIYHIINN